MDLIKDIQVKGARYFINESVNRSSKFIDSRTCASFLFLVLHYITETII